MDISKRRWEAKDQGAAVSRPPGLVRSAAGRTPLLVRVAFVRLCLIISAAACLILAGELARAESIESFFRGLGRKIKNSIEQKPEHHSNQKTTHKRASSDQIKTPSAGPTAAGKPEGVHTQKAFAPTVRKASAASGGAATQGLPFAAPVPGKKGYVTSPFSTDGNYIDVSGFPPGTEVKDPYSGKVFRVP